MYAAFKHAHMLFVALSLCLFILRFIWKLLDSKMLAKKWVKITPHAVDTCLLLSGVALISITNFMPFYSGVEWMTEKLFCVVAYIALGYIALHRTGGTLFRTFAFCGALGWLYLAASLAITKTPYY